MARIQPRATISYADMKECKNAIDALMKSHYFKLEANC